MKSYWLFRSLAESIGSSRHTEGSLLQVPFSCLFGLTVMVCIFGCRAAGPGGSPIEPRPLGSVVDETSRIQEQNAEFAHFIVYVHEFELNEPKKKIRNPWASQADNQIQLLGPGRPKEWKLDEIEPRGFRLNEYGLEHVRKIAKDLLSDRGGAQQVVVERSQSSKQWDTLHHYPVHFNARLDEERRSVVVNALVALGVDEADELVNVAPAFPEGLHSQEAAQAYQQTRFGSSRANNSSGGTGGF